MKKTNIFLVVTTIALAITLAVSLFFNVFPHDCGEYLENSKHNIISDGISDTTPATEEDAPEAPSEEPTSEDEHRYCYEYIDTAMAHADWIDGELLLNGYIQFLEDSIAASDANELNGIKTAASADGSVYVSSTYNKAFTFGGKEVADPEGLTSACIVKYNEKGQEQWAVALEGSAVVYALDTDADGTLYAAGSFIDVVKYTGTDGTTGELAGGADSHSAFVAKISKDGKVESVKTIAPVINAAILESFMYFPEPNYVYVTPNNIQIDGEKVYVSATYTADVEELGWKAAYLNVFDFMYMENKSAGIFSLDKANLANPTSVATVQNTENISYNQYYPEALDFTADNGTVYVGFFGFGNLTMATPAGNKDFTFGISFDSYVVNNLSIKCIKIVCCIGL